MLTLPDSLRDAFKEPLGPVTTDADDLLADAAETRGERGAPDAPIIAVGDVVTYHLREAGRVPDVALIDGKTEREAVDGALAAAGDGLRIRHDIGKSDLVQRRIDHVARLRE